MQRSIGSRNIGSTVSPKATAVLMNSTYTMNYSYADFVRRQSIQNPCLSGLATHMKQIPKVDSTIRLIEYDFDGTVPSNSAQLDQKELPRLFEDAEQTRAVGRVLLIENLRPDVISCLGEHLDLDPMFFADHITTNFQGIEQAPPPPALAFCPSQIVQRSHVHIHFQQVIDLGYTGYHKNPEYVLHMARNIPRNIRRLPHLSGRQLALSRACCSILVKRHGGTWYSK